MHEIPSVIKSRFNDFDQYAHFIKQADIEHVQLGPGSFNGALLQLVYGPVILSCHSMNQTILQRGQGIEGYTTFLIPGNMQQDFTWRKNRLKGNVIGILKSGMEHDCITIPNFYGFPVSIENDYLLNLSENLGYTNFMKLLSGIESVEIHRETAMKLHAIILKNCSDKRMNEEEILIEIPKRIIKAISETEVNYKLLKGTSRRKIFKRGQEFIHANIDTTISIMEIGNKLGVSERNLRYAFKDQSGLSPKQYLERYKLNQVRKILKSGASDRIVDVIHRFGYWHAGQFAADYKKLFGELPSQTKN